MSEQWFVARAKPSKETVAACSIAAKGFPVFLPVNLVWRTRGGKREQIARPLFPRYLFTQFDRSTDDYGAIYACRGVAHSQDRKGLICDAMDRPIPVHDHIINGIREAERIQKANAGLVTTGYRPGDKFRYPVSPYADLDVTFVGEHEGDVTIMFVLCGRSFMRQIPFERVPLKGSFDTQAA